MRRSVGQRVSPLAADHANIRQALDDEGLLRAAVVFMKNEKSK